MDRVELRKSRCENGALGTMQRLSSYSAEQIIIRSYFHTDNDAAREMMKRYEQMLILAKQDFASYENGGRDRLLLELSAYIHQNKLFREWIDFIYILNQNLEENLILDAYKSEAMETWNYLVNYEPRNIYGLTSDNELIIYDNVYGDWDIPLQKIRKRYKQQKITVEKMFSQCEQENEKHGFFMIERHENMIDIDIFEMMPFINERTKVLRPHRWLEMGWTTNINLPRQWKKTEFYREKLKRRSFMIDRKGCKAYLRNAGNIKEVFFMESVTKDKKIIMLYRVTTEIGGFYGYYHMGDEYFFSPYRGSDEKQIHFDLENFILELYAEIVCGLDKDVKRIYALKEVEDIEHIDQYKETHVYVQFGLFEETRDKEEQSRGGRGAKQRPHERGVAIRKLRPGQQASEEAAERAKEYGIELQDGFTFVRSYSVGGVKDVRVETLRN